MRQLLIVVLLSIPLFSQNSAQGGAATGGSISLSSSNGILLVTPTMLACPDTQVGSSSQCGAGISLVNVGGASITSLAVSNPTGANSTSFSQGNNCPATLTVGSGCTITVTFTPLITGSLVASIAITSSVSPVNVALSGTGMPNCSGPPTIQVSPANINFGTIIIGQTSSPQTVTYSNISSCQTATITNIAISGTNAADFTQPQPTTCILNTPLPAGSSCQIFVVFTPSLPTTESATLTFSDNSLAGSETVALSGTGQVAPAPNTNFQPAISGTTFRLTTNTAAFGTKGNTGQLTSLAEFDLWDDSAKAVAQTSWTASADATDPSSSVQNGIDNTPTTFWITPLAAAPGQPHYFQVNTGSAQKVSGFSQTPRQDGCDYGWALSSFLNVDSVTKWTGTFPYTGETFNCPGASQARVQFVGLLPGWTQFADQTLNTTSPPLIATLQNTGTATLNISNLQVVSGQVPGEFALSNNACGATLAAGATCDISVTFTPTTTGLRTGAIQITDDSSSGSPQIVPLSGFGGNPPPAIQFMQAACTTNTGPGTPCANQAASTSYNVSLSLAQCPTGFTGCLNVVIISSDVTVSSISDLAGNTYAVAVARDSTGSTGQTIWYAKNISNYIPGNVVTVHFSSTPTNPQVDVLEYAGIQTGTTIIDTTASAHGTSDTFTATTNPATSYGNDLLVGGETSFSQYKSGTVNAGWLARLTPNRFWFVGDNFPVAQGSYSLFGQITASGAWVAQFAAFKGQASTINNYASFHLSGAGTGNGSVTSNVGGINCQFTAGVTSGNCQATLPKGTSVTLTASASSGSYFAGWSGGTCSGFNLCNFTLNTDQTIIATFTLGTAPNRYYVDGSSGGCGGSGCSDSNDGLTLATAWQHLQKCVSSTTVNSAGAECHIQPATYTETRSCGSFTSSVCLNKGGTSSSVHLSFICDNTVLGVTFPCLIRTGKIGIVVATLSGTSGNHITFGPGFDIGNAPSANMAFVIACDQAGALCGNGNDVIITGNTMHDFGQTFNGDGFGPGCLNEGMILAQNHHGNYVTGLQVIGNLMYNYGKTNATCTTGSTMGHCIYANAQGSIIENNITHDCASAGIQVYDNACNSVVSNNTSFHNGQDAIIISGGGQDQCSPGPGLNTADNNLVGDSGLDTGEKNGFSQASPGADCTSSRHSFYSNNAFFSIPGVNYFAAGSCDDHMTTINGTSGNLFVNYSGGDYRPIGQAKHGGTVNCQAGGQTPCVPSVDILGNPRNPVTPSVGAYE